MDIINITCGKCGNMIDSKNLTSNNHFWECSKCGKNNRKHILKARGYEICAKGELLSPEEILDRKTNKMLISKITRCTQGNFSIMETEKGRWYHKVLDRSGKEEIHKRHQK